MSLVAKKFVSKKCSKCKLACRMLLQLFESNHHEETEKNLLENFDVVFAIIESMCFLCEKNNWAKPLDYFNFFSNVIPKNIGTIPTKSFFSLSFKCQCGGNNVESTTCSLCFPNVFWKFVCAECRCILLCMWREWKKPIELLIPDLSDDIEKNLSLANIICIKCGDCLKRQFYLTSFSSENLYLEWIEVFHCSKCDGFWGVENCFHFKKKSSKPKFMKFLLNCVSQK